MPSVYGAPALPKSCFQYKAAVLNVVPFQRVGGQRMRVSQNAWRHKNTKTSHYIGRTRRRDYHTAIFFFFSLSELINLLWVFTEW